MLVLIVDHNPDIRTAMRLLLTEKMHVDGVLEVSDLKGLKNILVTRQPEIILLDWELPGFSVEKHLPELQEQAPGSRIVIVSSQPESKKSIKNFGLNDFIGKYQDPDAILKVLNKCQEEIVKLSEK